MDKFNLREYLKHNPLLKENDGDDDDPRYSEERFSPNPDNITMMDDEEIDEELKENIETLLSPEDLEYYRAHRDEIEDILHAEWRSSKLSAKDAVEKHKEDKLQQAKRGGGKESTLRKLAAIGKHSQSKKSLKEDIDPNQKKYTEEEWKYELDLNAKMAARLIAHQANGGDWGDLVDDLVAMQKQSRIPTNIEFFEGWIKDQEDNELPNSSSGSFFTGLTDIDGLLSAMNFEEYVEVDGERVKDGDSDSDDDLTLYSDEEYDKAVDYHNMIIKQEVPDMFKY